MFSFSAQADFFVGPVGGTGGAHFEDIAGNNEHVCGLYVRHGARIDAIQLKICRADGSAYRSARRGGSGGSESYIPLDNGPVESSGFPVFLRVYLGYRSGNQRVFGISRLDGGYLGGGGIYGTETSQSIDFEVSKITGIWGRSGSVLDAIGIVYTDFDGDFSVKAEAGGGQGDLSAGVGSGKNCRSIGVRHGKRIDAIKFYNCAGGDVDWVGGNGGAESHVHLLGNNEPFPTDTIYSIEGSTVKVDGIVRISSITIKTKKGASYSYGTLTSQIFKLQTSPSHQGELWGEDAFGFSSLNAREANNRLTGILVGAE